MHEIASRPSSLRVWLVALRPFSFTVSIAPVLFGAILAWEAGFGLPVVGLLALLASVICLHGAANLLNDYHDFLRGLDQQVYPVSGALVRGWLSARQVRWAAIGSLLTGVLLAVLVVWLRGLAILFLGAAGVLLALGYTRKGLCLKYLGLGDPAIFLAFGVLPVLAGWWIVAGHMAWQPLWWSLPPGLLAVGILHANNWRDREGDASKGCRTLAVRIGARGSRWYFRGLLASAFFLVPGLAAAGWGGLGSIRASWWTLSVLLVSPEVYRLVMHDWPADPDVFVALDARVARLHMLFTLLLAAGFMVAALRQG